MLCVILSGIVIGLIIYYRYVKNIFQQENKALESRIEQQKQELEKKEQEYLRLKNEFLQTKEELLRMRVKAEESDRLKSAFLSNISHEIRTPMNAIIGFASLIEDPETTEEEKAELISLVNSNAESLLILIEDILDLSLIESKQLILKPENFNLNQLLDNLYSTYYLNKKKGELELLLNNPLREQNLQLYSDQYRIRQVLSNLLNNAYKFTPQGTVEFGVKLENNHLNFYVKDTGIGISENESEVIFNVFRKSSFQTKRVFRGTGMGLAISKKLSEILGGRLSLKSVEGQGSVFYLSLPLEKVKINELIPQQKDIKAAGVNFENRNILIVEDEEVNYLFLKKALKNTKAHVEWARDGQNAIDLVSSKENFDLILMDIKMPVMDGFEATKIIKSKYPSQKIIAQTAYARPEDEQMINSAGFDDYLPKPIRPYYLYNMLKKYL
ncbi:MAG: response regulator [Bacteroidales bacterium]|nr:response regulator [Bacteroidales bacterium]